MNNAHLLSPGRAIVEPLNVSQLLAAYNASPANVLELKTTTVTGTLKPGSDRIYGRGDLFWANMATTSCTLVGSSADSPEPILRPSPTTGYDAGDFPYKRPL
jgi:hypothetical protein